MGCCESSERDTSQRRKKRRRPAASLEVARGKESKRWHPRIVRPAEARPALAEEGERSRDFGDADGMEARPHRDEKLMGDLCAQNPLEISPDEEPCKTGGTESTTVEDEKSSPLPFPRRSPRTQSPSSSHGGSIFVPESERKFSSVSTWPDDDPTRRGSSMSSREVNRRSSFTIRRSRASAITFLFYDEEAVPSNRAAASMKHYPKEHAALK